MFIWLLIRRLGPRGRVITGATLLALGAAVFAASAALSINLYIHGAILMVLGAIVSASAVTAKRRPVASASAKRPVAVTSPHDIMAVVPRNAVL
jgi:hypothetical protein